MTTILTSTTSTTGYVLTPNTTGTLVVQTGSGVGTTALTIDASQNATFAGTVTATGGFVGAATSGSVQWFAMNTAPSGYLKANGAAISRTAYAALFSAIGTVFGVGDGSTTFNIPDLRGEFLRGWDDGRGIDTGRVFGTAQADQFQGHQHSRLGYGYGSGANTANGGGTAATTVVSGPPNTVDGTNGTPRVGTETRPINIALLACIKF